MSTPWRPIWPLQTALWRTARGHAALLRRRHAAAVLAVLDAEIDAFLVAAARAGMPWAQATAELPDAAVAGGAR